MRPSSGIWMACSILIPTVILFIISINPNHVTGQIIEEPLLEEIEKASFLFFWEQTDARTGQIKDRSLSRGNPDNRSVASIASTGKT